MKRQKVKNTVKPSIRGVDGMADAEINTQKVENRIRWAEGQTDRQTDRQTDTQTDRHTDTPPNRHTASPRPRRTSSAGFSPSDNTKYTTAVTHQDIKIILHL